MIINEYQFTITYKMIPVETPNRQSLYICNNQNPKYHEKNNIIAYGLL